VKNFKHQQQKKGYESYKHPPPPQQERKLWVFKTKAALKTKSKSLCTAFAYNQELA
jgi:hypothetical protein